MRLPNLSRALLVALLAPMGVARAEEPEADTGKWIATLDKAFAAPPAPLKPPLLIFPILNSGDRVSADGVALSNMASFAAVYTKHKRIALCVPFAQEVLRDAGCLKTTTKLDKETIQLCLDALGAKLYAIPKLVHRDSADVLTIVCHGDGGKHPDRTFAHTLKPSDRRRVPGLIAQSVLEYLGVELTPEEREMVVAPQVRDEQDLRTLLDIESGRLNLAAKPTALLDLLARNPRCVAGWEKAIISHATRVEAMRRFRELQPPLECPRPQVSVAVQVRELGEPERALRMLLPLVASHRGDTAFHSTMMKCAMLLKDDRLTRHVLELWRKAEPGYSGCVARADRLIQWAWDARGNDWGNTITPEGGRLFEQRLQDARRELEKGLQLNPSGWTAHTHLLTVAKGLGAPNDFMEEHFQKAIELRPRYTRAYQNKMEYLRPRWHGTPEEMIAFGAECGKSSFWDESIPLLFPYALRDCSTNPVDLTVNYELFKEPAVWQAILDFYRNAEKNGDAADRRFVLNELVNWGVHGEHYEDVVVPFQKLRAIERVDRQVFRDFIDLEYLYDRVHAKTGKLMMQLKNPWKNDLAAAKAGVALAAGDFESADKLIAQFVSNDIVTRTKAGCYRAAVAVSRKLAADKSITLQGAEGLESFLGARPGWKHDGSKFVSDMPIGWESLTWTIGIPHGAIDGTFEWTGDVSFVEITTHTRSLRDQALLRYDIARGVVALVRNNKRIQEAPFRPGPVSFHLEYGLGVDSLSPVPGTVWRSRQFSDEPSGFRIQVFSRKHPAVITIGDLRIALKD